jgi:phosphoribosylformylglycinamidine synthase
MQYRAAISVTLKPSVLDPQGVAVLRALGALDFDEVTDVRVGRYIELRLAAPSEPEAHTRVTAMCERLLANTVIERYEFSLSKESA